MTTQTTTIQTTNAAMLELLTAMPAAMLMTDTEINSAVAVLNAYVQQDVSEQQFAGYAWGQLEILNAEIARRERAEQDRRHLASETIAEVAAVANLPIDAVVHVLTYDWDGGPEAMAEYLATESVDSIASWVRAMVQIDVEMAA